MKTESFAPQIQRSFWSTPNSWNGLPTCANGFGVERPVQRNNHQRQVWPMPEKDAEEIEKQVEELISAGLVGPCPKGKFPTYCTPTFLVARKESKTRRMVGKNKKVNQMTKCHAVFLPNMESMIEKMASCKWKSNFGRSV